jgi:hypothetical protein
MRSPFHSESEAFRFLLLSIVGLVLIALAAALGPAWLALAALAVVLAAAALRVAQLRVRKLRGFETPLKMAPPHVGPPGDRRILVVAADTLGEEALLGEIGRMAAASNTRVLLLAPASISSTARLTGAVDGILEQARVRMATALDSLGSNPRVAGEVSAADPLAAVEDAFATFAPDEVLVSTRRRRAAGALEPRLAGLVRERFAVPVRHLVFEPGAAAREPDRAAEATYRREFGTTAARKFAAKALAGTAVLAALVMSTVALAHSGEREEARADSRYAVEPPVENLPPAKAVSLEIIPEDKPGPEGEKHDVFTTNEFVVVAGRPQELKIDNTDDVPHSITSPEAGVKIVAMPGTHTYTLLVHRAGRFIWYCAFPCDEWAMHHPGYMMGYIIAAPAAA